MDNIIVGIGASAGGLEALRAFVSGLQPTGRISYVVTQHLSPSHDSMLTKILAEESHMTVLEAADRVKLQPDTVYVAPPNRDIVMEDAFTLTTQNIFDSPPPHPNIDYFFASLADKKQKNCVGIILSGTGTDGTVGFKAIKDSGGLTIAQDDVSAKYNSMPHSAVSAGLADTVCAPADMFQAICRLTNVPVVGETAKLEVNDETIDDIIQVLADRSNMDVSQYKPGTIYRRIHMRIKNVQAASAEDYLELIRRDQAEVENLRDALLISVTSFFRDADSWKEVEEHVRAYLDAQGNLSSFRAWVAGCATGEEAYSLAILLTEILGEKAKEIIIQIFATDLDGAAIETARAGLYSREALAGVPQDLIDKYFIQDRGRYRVIAALRERCVFARHDLVRSPPFMHIDLITCRNVLIYFDDNLQETAFKIFHVSLRRYGLMMLGRSEAATRVKDLFRELDRRNRIYEARDVTSVRPPVRFGEAIIHPTERSRKSGMADTKPTDVLNKVTSTFFAPPSALLDDNLTVLASTGKISQFMQINPGETTMDIVSLVPKAVGARIRALLHKVANSKVRANTRFRKIEEWDNRDVIVEAIPCSNELRASHHLVISFLVQEEDESRAPTGPVSGGADSTHIAELERDLALTQEHLQTVVEELEISNEELQTMNEELQSTNEELQASNEQLETSNEELQSSNEELVTVNDELERKSDELTAALNEHEAILETFGAPVLLLDSRRALMRCNIEAFGIMDDGEENLGRYIDEISFAIPIPDLQTMISKAQKAGEAPYDMVQTPDGKHYLIRVKHIARRAKLGAAFLIVFQDQTEIIQVQDDLRRNQRLLRAANDRQSSIINALAAHVALVDHTGVIIQVNEQWRLFGELNGYNGADFGVGRNYLALCETATGDCSEESHYLAAGLKRVLEGETDFYSMEYPCHSPTEKRWFDCIVTGTDFDGHRGAAVMHMDITQRKVTEVALKEALRKAEEAEHSKTNFVSTMSQDLRTPLNAIIGYGETLHQSDLTDEQRRQSEVIVRSGRALATIIDDILELSSNELLADNAELGILDYSKIVMDIHDLLVPKAEEKGLKLKLDVSETGHEQLFSDMRRLRQIILALLGNAIRYTDSGTVTLRAKPVERVRNLAYWLRFEIQDTGPGLARPDMDRVFETLDTGDLHTLNAFDRIGLGLDVCRNFVRQMGGQIGVESTLGEGSLFWVEIPALTPEAMAADESIQNMFRMVNAAREQGK